MKAFSILHFGSRFALVLVGVLFLVCFHRPRQVVDEPLSETITSSTSTNVVLEKHRLAHVLSTEQEVSPPSTETPSTSSSKNFTDCNQTTADLYREVLECDTNITCSTFLSSCSHCDCIFSYRYCIEVAVSTDASLRESCVAASSLYLSLLAVATGDDVSTTDIVPSCYKLLCSTGLTSCSCTSAASGLTTSGPSSPPQTTTSDTQTPSPPRAPSTSAPPILSTPSPPVASDASTIAPTTTPLENGTALIVHITLEGTVETFNVTQFVQLVATAMNISASRITVISVESGSVVVQFYFTSSSTTSGVESETALELVGRFLADVVATGNDNVFTKSYKVLNATAAIGTVPAPGTTPTASPDAPAEPPSTPTPTQNLTLGSDEGDENESPFGSLSLLQFSLIVGGSVLFIGLLALIVWKCFGKTSGEKKAGNLVLEHDDDGW